MESNNKLIISEGVIEYGDNETLVLISNKNEEDKALVLNSSSITIYNMLKNGNSVASIVDLFVNSYKDYEKEAIESDIDDIITILIEYGVLVPNE